MVVPTIASEVVGGGEKTDGHNQFQGLEKLEIEKVGKENLTPVNFQFVKKRGVVKDKSTTHVSNRFDALDDGNNLNIIEDNLEMNCKKESPLGQLD